MIGMNELVTILMNPLNQLANPKSRKKVVERKSSNMHDAAASSIFQLALAFVETILIGQKLILIP